MNINKSSKNKSKHLFNINTEISTIEISIVGTGFDEFFKKCNDCNVYPELISTEPHWPFCSTFIASSNNRDIKNLINFAESNNNLQLNIELDNTQNLFSIWKIENNKKTIFNLEVHL